MPSFVESAFSRSIVGSAFPGRRSAKREGGRRTVDTLSCRLDMTTELCNEWAPSDFQDFREGTRRGTQFQRRETPMTCVVSALGLGVRGVRPRLCQRSALKADPTTTAATL